MESPSSADTLEQAAERLAKMACARVEKRAAPDLAGLLRLAQQYPEIAGALLGGGGGALAGLVSDFSRDPEERAPLRSAMSGGLSGGLLGLGGGLGYRHGGELLNRLRNSGPAPQGPSITPPDVPGPAATQRRIDSEFTPWNRPGASPPKPDIGHLEVPPDVAAGGPEALKAWQQQQELRLTNQELDQLGPGLMPVRGPATGLGLAGASYAVPRMIRPTRGTDMVRGVAEHIGDQGKSPLGKNPAYTALQNLDPHPEQLDKILQQARNASPWYKPWQRMMPERFGSNTPISIGAPSMPAGGHGGLAGVGGSKPAPTIAARQLLNFAQKGRAATPTMKPFSGRGALIGAGVGLAAPWLIEGAKNYFGGN